MGFNSAFKGLNDTQIVSFLSCVILLSAVTIFLHIISYMAEFLGKSYKA